MRENVYKRRWTKIMLVCVWWREERRWREKEEKKNKLWLMELGIERREKDIEVDVMD